MNIAIVTSTFTIGSITYSPGDEIDDPVTVALIQGNAFFSQKAAIVSGTPGTISAPAGTTTPSAIPSPAVLIEAIAGINAVDYMTPVASDALIQNRIAILASKGDLGIEVSRAMAAEQTLTTGLAAEIARAQASEQANAAGVATNVAGIVSVTSNLAAEVVRATTAEQINATAIAATNTALAVEVTRATGVEATLVPQTTSVSAGAGLTGGGPLSTNIALSIAPQGVTTAMLAPSPPITVRANVTGASASPADVAPSSLFDAAFGSTSGTLLFRGSTLWNGLGIGAQGQVLTVSAGGLPVWTSVSGTGTVTQVNTGSGLTGGPITGSGTISLSNLPVYADTAQTLTGPQQLQARQNAGAAASGSNADITALTGLTAATGTGSVVLATSPALIGIPTATTAAFGSSTTQIANMAALQAAVTPLQAILTPLVALAAFNFCASQMRV